MKKIGFIGIGVMGKSMAQNLQNHGYELTVYSRTRKKAEPLLEKGALWAESPAECAKGQDAVITMVGYPKDVEEVYFGEKGIFAGAGQGTYLIDMTTTSPKLSEKIYEEGKKRGIHVLDAPVSGGDSGARNGTLSIMAGGDPEDFEACRELFLAMGKEIHYEGKAGCGQHTKMANQIALAGIIGSLCEAIAYGRAHGLSVPTMLDSMKTGAAGSWQMTNMAPRILEGDMEPGFFIKHFIKDMTIASEEADKEGLYLDVLETVLSMYKTVSAEGYGDAGTQALIRYYE